MKQFLITLAGVFAGLLLFFVAIPALLVAWAIGASQPAALPGSNVLTLDLREGLTDQEAQNPFFLSDASDSVLSVIRTLRRAESDDKVKALLVRLPEGGMEPAAAEELRLAFKSFQAKGKRVIAHSQGVYPIGISTSTYMLGAAADEFWMQPNAQFQAVGLATEEIFFKGFFDRYGVEPDFQKRAEYKNAVNPFLETTYTPEHREATLSWLGSVYGGAIANAAADSKLTPAALRTALEGGPYTAAAARQAGLVDQLGHIEDVEKALLDRYGDVAEALDFDDYASRAAASATTGPIIAIVEAEGAIVTGTNDGAGFGGGGQTIFSDDVAKALREAAEDDDVEAVVFRVSSPGGSDVASEQILQAVNAVKKAGKPLVVSMGTYAASGGYWVASQADAIVAHPSTLTGSIGVYGGKFALGPALERFGVNVEGVQLGGEFASAYDVESRFSDSQRAAFAAMIDDTYQGFITRVASGRKLAPARVAEIARGRIWTGAQARQLGLVDRLGGYYAAVDEAKKRAGIKPETAVRFKRLPAARSPFEALEDMLGVSAQSARTLAAAGWILGDPRAAKLMDALMEARLRTSPGKATVLAPTPLD